MNTVYIGICLTNVISTTRILNIIAQLSLPYRRGGADDMLCLHILILIFFFLNSSPVIKWLQIACTTKVIIFPKWAEAFRLEPCPDIFWDSSPRAIRLERLSPSPPFSTEFTNAWSYTSSLPYVYLSRSLIKHRGNFTSYGG
jgi:hypothetical protein